MRGEIDIPEIGKSVTSGHLDVAALAEQPWASIRSALEPWPQERSSVQEFLEGEAWLLDDHEEERWLELLSPAIDYRVPVRSARERRRLDGATQATGYHMLENHISLVRRVRRLETEHAWAEEPPTQTRRLVGNVQAWRPTPGADGDGNPNVAIARSSIVVALVRPGRPGTEVLSGERRDILERGAEGWRLAGRAVLLDLTVSRLPALSVLL